MSRLSTHRVSRIFAVIGTLAVTAAVTTSPAKASTIHASKTSTIHACYKSKTGAVRIVSKRMRCHKGERKLAWNTQGTAGATGADGLDGSDGSDGLDGVDGADGLDGTNGAVTGYSARQFEPVNITDAEAPVTALSESIEPGSFIVTGKVQLIAHDSGSQGRAGVECELIDIPTGLASSVLDNGSWLQSVDVPIASGGDSVEGSLAFSAATDTGTAASELAIQCAEIDNEPGRGELEIGASEAVIDAVQTTENR